MLGFYGVLLGLCGIILLLWPFLACGKSKYTRHWYISTLTRGAEQLIIFRCLNSEKLSGYLSVEVPFSGERTENNGWQERRKNCIDSHDTHLLLTACRTSVLTMEMLYFEDSKKCNSCGGLNKTRTEYLKFTSTPGWSDLYPSVQQKPKLSDLAFVVQSSKYCVWSQIFPVQQLYSALRSY